MAANRPLHQLLFALILAFALQNSRPAVAQDAAYPFYLPLVRLETARPPGGGLSKWEAKQLYESDFLPHTQTGAGWTGDRATCQSGTLAPAFTEATLQLVNYFRAAAGVAPVTFDATLNSKAQEAALMFSVNRKLSHNPPSSWKCYSSGGAEAAGNSNASLFYDSSGDKDVAGIRGQMEDMGPGNTAVGHRRWILLSTTTVMGMGHVPSASDYPAGGALWVLPTAAQAAQTTAEQAAQTTAAATREPFVAWPPPGYVPWQALYLANPAYYASNPDQTRLRWSLQLWGARFDRATVTATLDGTAVPVQKVAHDNNYNQSIVFVPGIEYGWVADGREHTIAVRVANVIDAGGTRRDFTYDVILFDAAKD